MADMDKVKNEAFEWFLFFYETKGKHFFDAAYSVADKYREFDYIKFVSFLTDEYLRTRVRTEDGVMKQSFLDALFKRYEKAVLFDHIDSHVALYEISADLRDFLNRDEVKKISNYLRDRWVDEHIMGGKE